MGCPTPKITKNGEGAALMKEPRLVAEIIRAVTKSASKPVTVKIRKGWDDNSINAVEIAKIAEDNGAKAITVHGRTREEFYRGKADLRIISDVKKAVRIPVIGNGDIFIPEDAKKMLSETGCDVVMIARGAQGNPWIFGRTNEYLETGKIIPEPSLNQKIEMIRRHMKMLIELKGEHTGILEMRKHIAWYIKGMKNAAHIRQEVFRLSSEYDIVELLKGYLAET
jgi:nifR3 family TIM-barrel protein